jgi:AraC-like DNA-binding protein
MASVGEMAQLVERHAGTDGVHATAIPRVSLYRLSQTSAPVHAVYEPAVCVVAQGRKQAIAGTGVYVYDIESHLLVSADVPVVSQVLEASADKPFLALMLRLEAAMLKELVLDNAHEQRTRTEPGPALSVSPMEPELLDPCVRMLRLLDSPRDIRFLAPIVEKEILYRLLSGAQTSRLSQFAYPDSRLRDINRAIAWIRDMFREPLSVDALALHARMSPSALHYHFKVVTGLSPLQYQKHLRLREARRLMLSQAMDAAVAGHLVGYECPSHFSREYRRLFGAPPATDVAKLRVQHGA